MANVRIIYDNALDRASSITASTTAVGGLSATSLKTNTKSLAHRSTSAQITYTITWTSAESMNGIILPATNLSSGATIAVTVNSVAQPSINACPNTTLDGYSGIKNVNSFPYGGLSKVAYWFTSTISVTTLVITLTDFSRTSKGSPAYPSYIDCSTIVCGKYWEPNIGVSKEGLDLTIADTTQTTRSDAGDLYSDRGTIHDELSFNLSLLDKTDKEELIKILKYIGSYRNIAVSIFPEGNTRNEQDYIIYGKRNISPLSYIVHNFYSNSFSITGW